MHASAWFELFGGLVDVETHDKQERTHNNKDRGKIYWHKLKIQLQREPKIQPTRPK